MCPSESDLDLVEQYSLDSLKNYILCGDFLVAQTILGILDFRGYSNKDLNTLLFTAWDRRFYHPALDDIAIKISSDNPYNCFAAFHSLLQSFLREEERGELESRATLLTASLDRFFRNSGTKNKLKEKEFWKQQLYILAVLTNHCRDSAWQFFRNAKYNKHHTLWQEV